MTRWVNVHAGAELLIEASGGTFIRAEMLDSQQILVADYSVDLLQVVSDSYGSTGLFFNRSDPCVEERGGY